VDWQGKLVSEYQCYEFVAVDRPLSKIQMAELRAISTRAEISSTRFWNEYHWGNLKADPAKLVLRYFDAHLYFANWGTHRLILRLPKARINVKLLKPYFTSRGATGLKSIGQYVVLDFTSDTEEPEYDEPGEGSLAALLALRVELMRGDIRPAYLAWLLAVQAGDVADMAMEPPVPAGLETLTAAQEAMVEFLRIDADLLTAAVSGSATPENNECFRHWVTRLPAKEKNAWLQRAVQDPDLALGSELLRVFRASQKHGGASKRRGVAELLARAETQRALRERAETDRERKAEQANERKRQRRLTKLSRNTDSTWLELEKFVESSSYDDAVKLAVDLHDLATREDRQLEFDKRFETMRKRQSRRRGFFDRWKIAEKEI
jgi:hypothetical protein